MKKVFSNLLHCVLELLAVLEPVMSWNNILCIGMQMNSVSNYFALEIYII